MKFLIFLLLSSCSYFKKDNKPADTVSPTHAASDKKDLYCFLSRNSYLENRRVVSECDGLLFTALHSVACDYVTLTDFEDNGRWFRDPAHKCGPDYGSDSTISKDMLNGVLMYLWHSKDSEATNRLIEYGKANNWVMGVGKDTITTASKCLMSPGQISILYDIQKGFSLNGTYTDPGSVNATIGNIGFAAHLDVLFIILSSAVYGAISDSQLQALKEQSERQPKNALFQAAYHRFTDGDQSIAMALIADTAMFPAEALPSSANYCTEYLYQRDEAPKDWAPCPQTDHKYDGTDLIFAASIIDGTFFKR